MTKKPVKIDLETGKKSPEIIFRDDVASDVADARYTHVQTMPSTRWVIIHNLGKKPSVRLTDDYGNEIYGEIDEADIEAGDNKTIVKFYYLQTGKAFLS